MITDQTHKLLGILESREAHILHVEMRDGEVFLLKIHGPIDTSIYGSAGGWNAEVISMVSDPDNKFHKPGNGLDFYEYDVKSVTDTTTNELLFEAASGS
ncbi:MAG: hypothetical protein HZC54_23355 [Verrucomicrobia bacterium]|nr:hypothetical protein [Verrucomicrobiota bacterium]